jgi:SAM-dependent methyltransferase
MRGIGRILVVEGRPGGASLVCMSFDILAPHYRWMERFLAQGKLQRCRMHGLDAALGAERLLLVGEGHGRFLEVLGKYGCAGAITCVDASARMQEVAKGKAEGLDVRFVHADILDWEPPGAGYDFLATHFFLDCFEGGQLAKVVGKLGEGVVPGGVWHVADFACPEKGLGRLRARVILWSMYRFFRPVTGLSARCLEGPELLIGEAGFWKEVCVESEWGLLGSTIWRKDG